MSVLNVAPGVSLPVDLVTESNGILGKKGSGKTSAGVVLYEEMYAAGVPVVAVDPKGDWYGIRSSSDGKHEGLPVPVFGGRHGDIPLEATAGTVVADLILHERLSCILDVSEFSIAERRRFLTPFADRLYRAADRDPMHVFLEESHEYIPQFVKGDDAAMVGVFERLVKNGRFKGIGVSLLTQRSASLNKNVLTQVDNLFVMRTIAAQDRLAVKGWVEVHADASELLASLPSLPTGECWLWQPSRGEPMRFRFRMRTTFDAGATPKVGEKRVAPTNLADVDLAAISAAMVGTIEKAKADDPKVLRRQIAELQKQITAPAAPERVEVPVEVRVTVPVLSDEDHAFLAGVVERLDEIMARFPDSAMRRTEPPSAPTAIVPRESAPRTLPPRAAAGEARGGRADGAELRAGARRMVETLGRMHPLRLTKAQWGTVSHMKTTSGTWSTYLGDIRRLGFLDENSIGYTLSPAGFEYLGGQPDPMTPAELQSHYRKILRAGAVRMLDFVMTEYPAAVSREQIGAACEMSTGSGTFSTYLGDLNRNGLIERVDGGFVATEILMHGSAVVA